MNKTVHKNVFSSLLLLGIIGLIFCCATSYIQYNRLSQTYYNLIDSYQTIRAANQTIISINEAALSISTFLQSQDDQILNKIPEFIISAEVNFQALKMLVSDNSFQTTIANQLTPIFTNKIIFLNQIINEYTAGHVQQAVQLASDKIRLKKTYEIEQLIIKIKQEEIKQLNESNTSLTASKHSFLKMITLMGVLTGVIFLFCFISLNSYLKKY